MQTEGRERQTNGEDESHTFHTDGRGTNANRRRVTNHALRGERDTIQADGEESHIMHTEEARYILKNGEKSHIMHTEGSETHTKRQRRVTCHAYRRERCTSIQTEKSNMPCIQRGETTIQLNIPMVE